MRAIWKGAVSFGLVSVPVKLDPRLANSYLGLAKIYQKQEK